MDSIFGQNGRKGIIEQWTNRGMNQANIFEGPKRNPTLSISRIQQL